MNPELLSKLQKIYGKDALEADIFGKRPATPAEIAALLSQSFSELEPRYAPSDEDVKSKGSDHEQR